MRLVVLGLPVPQGSKSAHPFRRKDGSLGVAVHEGGKAARLKDWRRAIADAARAWMAENGLESPADGPLALVATFYLPRPSSAPKRLVYPAKKPDCSKLIRAVEDAMTGIVYTDDARIVDLRVYKRFAVDSPPRVEIHLSPPNEREPYAC
jgi:crossover junction endodeoxyribonuclease RusA